MPPKKGKKTESGEPEVPEEAPPLSPKSKQIKKDKSSPGPAAGKRGSKKDEEKSYINSDKLNAAILEAISVLKSKANKKQIGEHVTSNAGEYEDGTLEEALGKFEKEGRVTVNKGVYKVAEKKDAMEEESGKKKSIPKPVSGKKSSEKGFTSMLTSDEWIGIDFAPPKMEQYIEPKSGKTSSKCHKLS